MTGLNQIVTRLSDAQQTYSGRTRSASDRRLEARVRTETEQRGGHGNASASGNSLAGSTPAPGAKPGKDG